MRVTAGISIVRISQNVKQPGSRIVTQFLRSPRTIIGEVAAIAFAGVLGAIIPQAGTASSVELARLHENGPLVSALIDILSLGHVFRSAWFLAFLFLATASLTIVVIEQFRRLSVTWSRRLGQEQFRHAPFHVEFERPPRLAAVELENGPRVAIRTHGRLGLAGSPLFHFGLLLVILAGALRALFAVDAVVDLMETETLPPTAAAWAAQSSGLLAGPFRLDAPLTLDAVQARRYDTGELRELSVRLSLDRPEGTGHEEMAINKVLQAPGGRLFMDSSFGPAALIEWQNIGGAPVREAVLMTGKGKGVYEGSSDGQWGVLAHLRARIDRLGNRPAVIEVRVVNGRALLFVGTVQVGGAVLLPDGRALAIHGAPFWVRLHGSRDRALWLAYTGFALAVIGAAIMFIIIKVDTCVSVHADGDREQVFVALRSQRFAPMFQERFRMLVREQGGQA